jgi:hypothetical protein
MGLGQVSGLAPHGHDFVVILYGEGWMSGEGGGGSWGVKKIEKIDQTEKI